ncbi:MAG: hypothetical protein AAFY26_27140, partial [Cyanobacteria bacterium J06638_22]
RRQKPNQIALMALLILGMKQVLDVRNFISIHTVFQQYRIDRTHILFVPAAVQRAQTICGSRTSYQTMHYSATHSSRTKSFFESRATRGFQKMICPNPNA